jgi:hypothetical protein
MSDNAHSIVKLTHRDSLLEQAVTTFVAGMALNTQRAYSSRLNAFLVWRDSQPSGSFVTHLKQYVAYLREEQGLSPRSVQAHINTIKGMLRTAAALEPSLAVGLPQLELVKTPHVRGEIQGKRLTAQQARVLLDAPGRETIKEYATPRYWACS